MNIAWIVLLAVLLLIGLFYYCFIFEPRNFETRLVRLRIPKLSSGIKILMVSDLHLYRGIPDKRLKKMRETILRVAGSVHPDLFVIAGDMVDTSSGIDMIPGILGGVPATMGSYAVLGNHDYWEYNLLHVFQPALEMADKKPIDLARLKTVLADTGIRLLEDESVKLSGHDAIILSGLDAMTFKKKRDMSGLLNSGDGFSILLTHYPDSALLFDGKFDLILSGHTHGGQVTIFGYPLITRSKIRKSDIMGASVQEKGSVMVVSRGMGVSRYFPIRFFSKPDLFVIELLPA